MVTRRISEGRKPASVRIFAPSLRISTLRGFIRPEGAEHISPGQSDRAVARSAALGCLMPANQALKGRNKVDTGFLCRPFRAREDLLPFSWGGALRHSRFALPQAGLSGPFGANRSKTRNSNHASRYLSTGRQPTSPPQGAITNKDKP